MTTDRPSTTFWFVTIAAAYIYVARMAWQLQMRPAAVFGAVMATALVTAQWRTWWNDRMRQKRAQALAVGDRLLGRPPASQSQAFVARRSGWDWLMERLFPTAHYPSDFDEQRTYIHTDIRARLGVADRLRLLLTGDVRILITTYTDVEVKSCRALSNIEVQPFKE